jgi:acetate kinase
MEAVASEAPQIPQVVCFDTAFHRRLPELAQRFSLPRKLFDEGIRRYGFHGLSYEYVLQALGPAAQRQRLIMAHLGNGSSLAAVKDGSPMDTSMGLTPTGGVMMGTRAGDVDPGVLIFLLREKHYDADKLERLVDAESGLLGVSELTSDMKTLLAKRDSDPRAAEAVAMFCRSVRKEIGAFAAVLGGLDTLVFTGGIGERAPAVREEICRDLGHLGVRLDAARNNDREDVISAAQSACMVRVVATNEELMIARHTRAVIFGNAN